MIAATNGGDSTGRSTGKVRRTRVAVRARDLRCRVRLHSERDRPQHVIDPEHASLNPRHNARSGDPSLLAAALGLQAIEAAAADRVQRAQRMIDLAEQASRDSHQDFMVGRVKGMIAICGQLQGRWLESIALARDSQELQRRASRSTGTTPS